MHSLECTWANNFLETFTPNRELSDDEFIEARFTVCCCSPEIPHGEGLKFSLLTANDEIKNRVIFMKNDKTEIETISPLPEYLRPPYVGKSVLGRHVDIQNVVQLQASND